MQNILDLMKERYTTKIYDTTKKISKEDRDTILETLRLTATAVNIQPWHFILTESEENIEKLSQTSMGYNNTKKISDSAFSIIFCARTDITEGFITEIVDQEIKDGRYKPDQDKQAVINGKKNYIDNKKANKVLDSWLANQVYIALGTALIAAKNIGIDSTAIEGVHTDKIDETFDLKAKGLRSLFVVSFGYHSDEDRNFALKKSRLESEKVISII